MKYKQSPIILEYFGLKVLCSAGASWCEALSSARGDDNQLEYLQYFTVASL